MKGKFCLLPRLAIRGDHDAVPVVDPKYSPAERSAARVYPPRVWARRAPLLLYYYYYILLLLLLSAPPLTFTSSLTQRSCADPESFYPRCVIAAHNHYRVESSLERNKCALDRSRRILCERTVVASAVGSEVHDGQSEPVTFQVNIGGVSRILINSRFFMFLRKNANILLNDHESNFVHLESV